MRTLSSPTFYSNLEVRTASSLSIGHILSHDQPMTANALPIPGSYFSSWKERQQKLHSQTQVGLKIQI